MQRQYVLYGHGGAYNHGAEALTRCTIDLLRTTTPDCKIALSSHFPEQDVEFGIPADEIVARNLHGNTNAEIYASTIARINRDTICLGVGGDNYCYPNWQRYAYIHFNALERGAKSILWSCSIDRDAIDAEMMEALRTHHLITARESITYNTLLERGLDNVVKVADIAFALAPRPVECSLQNFAVINFSPLICRKNPRTASAFQLLVEYILRETDLDIALVPHVNMPMDNDCDALKMVHAHASKRVTLVSEKLSAAEYKYIVSRAQLCVTARTHLAIAAYASCVPTLAVGYNVKAAGIAADLGLGEYVLDVAEIEKLVDAFKDLHRDARMIRSQLQFRIPEYIQSATPAPHLLPSLLST